MTTWFTTVLGTQIWHVAHDISWLLQRTWLSQLKPANAVAIRWHFGGKIWSDDAMNGRNTKWSHINHQPMVKKVNHQPAIINQWLTTINHGSVDFKPGFAIRLGQARVSRPTFPDLMPLATPLPNHSKIQNADVSPKKNPWTMVKISDSATSTPFFRVKQRKKTCCPGRPVLGGGAWVAISQLLVFCCCG
jgi:hypothetical protein